nr:transposon TX1 uncharacterized [Tanacetum cinerariifolium]
KLRNLKNAIKKWQVDVRKNDRSQKCANISEIHDIEKKIDDVLDLIQRARIKWDIEGDENSKFFHGIINSKRRMQAIAGILHDDFLESHISLDEVKNAVWECGSNKAPGLDGANSSFFTLIPKISNPLFVKDFRPISLIGTPYNIISKLLANRLSKVIDKRQWNWSSSNIGTCNTAYLNDLLLEISQIDISVDEDTCTWVLSNDGTFSVKSVRRLIDSKLLPFISTPNVCDKFLPQKATKAKYRRLYVIFAALFWWIWRYRNSVTFSSDSIKKGDLFDNIHASSFS